MYFRICHSFTRGSVDERSLSDSATEYKEDGGSVIILFPRSAGVRSCDFRTEEFVAGRVPRVNFDRDGYFWIHWNIHNTGLPRA